MMPMTKFLIPIALWTLFATSSTQAFTNVFRSRSTRSSIEQLQKIFPPQSDIIKLTTSTIITPIAGSFHDNYYRGPISLKATIDNQEPNSLNLHHAAIRTRDIETAIKFYSIFGFNVETKFRSGPARAAWIINHNDYSTVNSMESGDGKVNVDKKGRTNVACRLELIEVPAYVLQEKEGERKRATNLLLNESLLGLNHYALDVTSYIKSLGKKEYYGLDQFLEYVNDISLKKFGKTLRVAVAPQQKVIGSQVYELAFLYDADGTLFELIRYIKELEQSIESGWDPWDGSGFVGLGDGGSADSGKDNDVE
mmetsp:Transcript_33725/g.40397  ORF Transcript_33725/g.40397 Transcript_33725/m.40397 type:complete len:309 (-) Transcript_33725:69-995(-)